MVAEGYRAQSHGCHDNHGAQHAHEYAPSVGETRQSAQQEYTRQGAVYHGEQGDWYLSMLRLRVTAHGVTES